MPLTMNYANQTDCEKKNLFLTCEVEDLRPLLANVDTDVRPSYSQVGATLVEHKGLDLEES